MSDSECDLDQLTALLEEDDNDGDVDDTKTKSSEEADDRNPHEKNEAHKCNGEEVMNTETIEDDELSFEELTAMIGQSDDDEEDNMLENQERKVAEIENDDEKEKEKEDDENSDNLETVKIVDEAGIKNACDKNSSAVHGNVGNDVNPVKSKSSEEKSGRDDNDITCDNDDKKQQINNDMDENNTVMEDNNNVPKEPDTEIQAEDNTKVRAENYGESMEDESAEGYYCFDDDFDPDMEEMMKKMENQIENTGSQVDSQSTFKSEEDFPQTSQEAQSDSEIAENLLSQNTEIVNQSEEELMEEETETPDGKTTRNKSDTEESENLGDWSDEEEMQDMEVEGSGSEAGENETTEAPSQEDILAEMKLMQDRMKQLESLLVKSGSTTKSHSAGSSKPSKSPSTTSGKPSKTKTTNFKKLHSQEKKAHIQEKKAHIHEKKAHIHEKKAHIQEKKVQSEGKHPGSVSGHSDKVSSINKTIFVEGKVRGRDSFKRTEYNDERTKSKDSETVKEKLESKIKKSPNSSEKQKDSTSEGSYNRKDKRLSERRENGHSDRREKGHHDRKEKGGYSDHDRKEKGGYSDKKRKRRDELILKDEDNPFFAATPTNQDSNLLATDPRSLFGDSDDSDWEGLDGEQKSNLSDEGRQINKLLKKGPGQRVAHTPKYDTSVLKKSPPPRWSSHSTTTTNKPVRKTKPVTIKPQLDPETGTVSGKYTLREEYKPKPVTAQLPDIEEKESTTDPYCGIRIINPRISMPEFKSKMSGRAMVKVSHIHQKVSRNDLQKDNWVTIGVVVHKTEPRQSAAGKQFCIWKLSDLKDCDKTITFFLFGNVYKEHWKNDTGTVIGLLNATMMDKSEKAQSEIAFTINHPQQMLIMGVSKDLGRCKGTTKAGNPCSQFINKFQGEFCTYHVTAAYKKSSAKRTELQASTGIAPKAFGEKGRKSKDSFWHYGGQTFTSMRPQEKSSKDQVTLKKLKHAEANKGATKVTTMSLHELEPEDEMKFKKLEDKDAVLLEKLMVPTVGSMNLVKHLVKKDKPQPKDPSNSNQPEMESISAKDLLKQHQNAMKQRMAERKKLAATPTLGKGFSVGQEISLDVPLKKTVSKSAELAKSIAIAKLKEKGGVQKEDPNAVRKKLMSPEQKEKIRKRVAEDIDTETKDSDPESSEPPKKRSKFLGNVDLNDPEVQKLLKSRSKHKGALAEAEAEHEDKYFGALEKKEKMEEKMDSVMEMEVKLFRCKQCQYTAYSLGDRCKKENHDYQVKQGMKRFFKCRHCKKRTETFLKFPVKPCQDCGKANYERVSMLKERKGPKLESEELSLRGNEQKYLGSLNQKNFVNL